MKRALLLLPLLAACGDDHFLVVTVSARPGVHDAQTLAVTLTNSETSLTKSLAVDGQPFPLTFSISAPGRSGDLQLTVDAEDADELIVGTGTVATTLDAPTAEVQLASADFVINTDFAGDQYPSDDYESNGNQLAVMADGTWTAAYMGGCTPTTPCNVFGRRFDAAGRAVDTAISASANGFPLSSTLTSSLSTPTIASAGMATIALWDAFSTDTGGSVTVQGVQCRSLDAAGNANAQQATIEASAFDDVVSVTGLATGNFFASWQNLTAGETHAAVIRPDCTLASAILVVATPNGNGTSVSAATDRALVTWVVDGDLHGRLATTTGSFLTADVTLVPKTATEGVAWVRSVATADGFAIVARWESSTGGDDAPGHFTFYKLNAAGTAVGAGLVVSTRSASSYVQDDTFGLAARADGALMLAWSACGGNGDGDACGVFGRLLHPSGTPASEEFSIATTIKSEQTDPSVAALPNAFVATWRDLSASAPDHAGAAARARIIDVDYTPE